MRKAVLQFKILVGKWEYLLILWPPKASNVDLFPSLLNLSPTKLEWSASSLSLSLPSMCGKPILDYTQETSKEVVTQKMHLCYFALTAPRQPALFP